MSYCHPAASRRHHHCAVCHCCVLCVTGSCIVHCVSCHLHGTRCVSLGCVSSLCGVPCAVIVVMLWHSPSVSCHHHRHAMRCAPSSSLSCRASQCHGSCVVVIVTPWHWPSMSHCHHHHHCCRSRQPSPSSLFLPAIVIVVVVSHRHRHRDAMALAIHISSCRTWSPSSLSS